MPPKTSRRAANRDRARGSSSFINLDANSMERNRERCIKKSLERERQKSLIQNWYTPDVSTVEKSWGKALILV